MKRIFTTLMIAIVTLALLAPSASAGDLSNVAKNLGRVIVCPLKAVARTAEATIDTVTCQKPTAILSVPKIVRQEAIDVVESSARMLTAQAPIGVKDVGKVNTEITDAGVDWLVDAVVYGAATGIVVHNGNDVGAIHHVGKAVATAAGGAAALDLTEKLID